MNVIVYAYMYVYVVVNSHKHSHTQNTHTHTQIHTRTQKQTHHIKTGREKNCYSIISHTITHTYTYTLMRSIKLIMQKLTLQESHILPWRWQQNPVASRYQGERRCAYIYIMMFKYMNILIYMCACICTSESVYTTSG